MDTNIIQSNANKIVRVTNISNFDFTSEMGAMFGGVPYFVPAGKSLLMPMPVGDHLATHLARQIIIRKAPIRDESQIDGKGSDRKLWDEAAINDLKSKIVTEVYEEEKPTVHTEAQMMAQKVEDLNKGQALETPLPTTGYTDKADVIEALTKRGIKYDARQSKANLEKLLEQPKVQ